MDSYSVACLAFGCFILGFLCALAAVAIDDAIEERRAANMYKRENYMYPQCARRGRKRK